MLSLAVPTAAGADPAPLTIGEPTHVGSGCEPGTVSTVFSPDQGTLSIFFDDYQVKAGNGEVKDRRGCVLNIPIQTAPGYRVAGLTVDYRGFMQAPLFGWLYFLAKYQVNGADALKPILKAWPHSFSEDFFLQHSITGPKPFAKFGCGQAFTLGIKSEMEAKKWLKFGEALLVLDSADLGPMMEVGVSVLPCSN
jgi:hypothetical protein